MGFDHKDQDDQLIGGTDGTIIGNTSDRLKVDAGLATDPDTNWLIVIDNIVSKIHSGNAYSHAHTHTIGNNEQAYHLFITPATTPLIHYSEVVQATGAGRFTLYEGPTTSANGFAANIYNRNRNSSNTTGLEVYHAPTFSATGNIIESVEFGTTGGNKANTSGFASVELILKANTKYLVEYDSDSSNNVFTEFHQWYEVDA